MGSTFINLKCTSCQACVPVCPTEAIYYGIHQYVIDQDRCHDCHICYQVCPEMAVTITKDESSS